MQTKPAVTQWVANRKKFQTLRFRLPSMGLYRVKMVASHERALLTTPAVHWATHSMSFEWNSKWPFCSLFVDELMARIRAKDSKKSFYFSQRNSKVSI